MKKIRFRGIMSFAVAAIMTVSMICPTAVAAQDEPVQDSPIAAAGQEPSPGEAAPDNPIDDSAAVTVAGQDEPAASAQDVSVETEIQEESAGDAASGNSAGDSASPYGYMCPYCGSRCINRTVAPSHTDVVTGRCAHGTHYDAVKGTQWVCTSSSCGKPGSNSLVYGHYCTGDGGHYCWGSSCSCTD